jgi:hypothetical protein
MTEIAELLAEYDRARAYTDELWRDLAADELHWRPEEEFSPIGWHLGHQAHVAHFMVRNLTAAEPSPMPDLDGVMDSANPEKLRLPLPAPARLGEFRTTVAERVHARIGAIAAGSVGAPAQLGSWRGHADRHHQPRVPARPLDRRGPRARPRPAAARHAALGPTADRGRLPRRLRLAVLTATCRPSRSRYSGARPAR